MTQRHFPMIGRRDALGLIAATVVADTIWTGPLQAAGLSAGRTIGASVGTPAGADVTPHLAGLTADHFEPLIGESFMVGDRAMKLREVRRGHFSGPQFRQQFGIVFETPRNLALQSEILPLSHSAVGRHDVHVSAIDAAGNAALEICFN